MDQIFWNARRTKPSRIGDAKRNEIRRVVTHVMGAIEHNGRVPLAMFGLSRVAQVSRNDFVVRMLAADGHGVRLHVTWHGKLVFAAVLRSDCRGGALEGRLKVDRWDRYPGGRAWARKLTSVVPERSERLLKLPCGNTSDVIDAFLDSPPFVQPKKRRRT